MDRRLLIARQPGTFNLFSEKRCLLKCGIMYRDGTDVAFLPENITITTVVRFKSVSSDPELNREVPMVV